VFLTHCQLSLQHVRPQRCWKKKNKIRSHDLLASKSKLQFIPRLGREVIVMNCFGGSGLQLPRYTGPTWLATATLYRTYVACNCHSIQDLRGLQLPHYTGPTWLATATLYRTYVSCNCHTIQDLRGLSRTIILLRAY
jgi:hypothetical protein